MERTGTKSKICARLVAVDDLKVQTGTCSKSVRYDSVPVYKALSVRVANLYFVNH